MIFVTVGTQFPFDRLIRAIDKLVDTNQLEEEVFGQVGRRAYRPRNFRYVESVKKQQYDEYISAATSIISHAGMGTITVALDNRKPLLVMPRLKEYGEAVNNHQCMIAEQFAKMRHLLMAWNEDELAERIRDLKNFKPTSRTSQASILAARISRFLDDIQAQKLKRPASASARSHEAG